MGSIPWWASRPPSAPSRWPSRNESARTRKPRPHKPRTLPDREVFMSPFVLPFTLLALRLAGAAQEKPILVFEAGGHTGYVNKVLFTPDGEQLITVSEDKTIRFWS